MLMAAKDEGDAEEQQEEGDHDDHRKLLLQIGQPVQRGLMVAPGKGFQLRDGFCLPGDDWESKGAHDDPLAIEHLEEKLLKDKWKMVMNLDEEPGVALILLHLRAAVRRAGAKHAFRALFGTSTHGESS